jgi:hypothetical protein
MNSNAVTKLCSIYKKSILKHLNKEIFHPIVICPYKGKLSEKMEGVGAEVTSVKIGRIRLLNLFVVKTFVSIMKKNSTCPCRFSY